MKKLFGIFLLLPLMGCNADQQSVDASVGAYNIEHQRVIIPPETLYDCPNPVVITSKKINTITELETAKILFKSVQNNRRCSASIKAIRSYIENAEKEFQK